MIPGRSVLVAPVSFHHGAVGFIGLQLRFERILFDGLRWPVAFVQRLGENVQRMRHPACVILPHRINRPEMVRRQHATQARDWAGSPGPGLVSVLNPKAPPWRVSRYQNDGATYSYGPVIFTPLGPTVVVLPAADEIDGFGHSNSCKISR